MGFLKLALYQTLPLHRGPRGGKGRRKACPSPRPPHLQYALPGGSLERRPKACLTAQVPNNSQRPGERLDGKFRVCTQKEAVSP
jgi:hypothetical protein